MKIDTLVLSGGGPAGIAYPSIFRALYENEILHRNLRGIKEIITTSIGILMAYCLLLKFENRVINEIITRCDIASMLHTDDISVDGLIFDSGLYETRAMREMFHSLTKRVLHTDDITLQELYTITKIKLSVKVFNITDKVYEFISHVTDPELSIITLAEMTTAVPILFKPISYRDKLYCDGGIKNGYPIGYTPSPNYLGIYLNNGNREFNAVAHIPILMTVIHIIQGDEEPFTTNERIIDIGANLGLDFGINDDTKQALARDAYNKTIDHIQRYLTPEEELQGSVEDSHKD